MDSPAALEVKSQWDHNHAPMSFSMTAAASIRPITRKMFIKSVTADSSLCLASHRFSMCSVGELFVAKYWTYLKKLQSNSHLNALKFYMSYLSLNRKIVTLMLTYQQWVLGLAFSNHFLGHWAGLITNTTSVLYEAATCEKHRK